MNFQTSCRRDAWIKNKNVGEIQILNAKECSKSYKIKNKYIQMGLHMYFGNARIDNYRKKFNNFHKKKEVIISESQNWTCTN
jgi:hypothetical protein